MKFGDYIETLLAVLLAFFIGWVSGRHERPGAPNGGTETKVDTLVIRDTITREKPVFVESYTVDTLVYEVTVPDYVHDTVRVYLPREVRIYQDSTYRAEVSGYMPSLDRIDIFQQTKIITKTERIRQRWGFSVTAGPAVILTPFHDVKVDAGVGIVAGVSYSF